MNTHPVQGRSHEFKKMGANNNDYITIIMLKALQWMILMKFCRHHPCVMG